MSKPKLPKMPPPMGPFWSGGCPFPKDFWEQCDKAEAERLRKLAEKPEPPAEPKPASTRGKRRSHKKFVAVCFVFLVRA
jgi:hypothetical protein